MSGTVLAKDFFSQQSRELFDPFKKVFNQDLSSANLPRLDPTLKKQIDLYKFSIDDARGMESSCDLDLRVRYTSAEESELAIRAVMANLQSIMMEKSVESVAYLSKELGYGVDQYSTMVSSIVDNYCSKNFTILSLKNLKKKFLDQFTNAKTRYPDLSPNINYSSFYSEKWKLPTGHEKKLLLSLRSFRAMCSWDGDVLNFRLLAPYLSDSLVMSAVFMKMTGTELDPINLKVKTIENPERFFCSDLICRKTSSDDFQSLFPKMIGSLGQESDLKILYCQNFIGQRYKMRDQDPQILKWIKETDLEMQRHEILHFQSLLHGMPYFLLALDKYSDFKNYLFKSISEKFDSWSKSSLDNFDKELLYEESIRFKVNKDWPERKLADGKFSLQLEIGLGEFDNSFGIHDKIDVTIPIQIPNKFIVWAAEHSFLFEKLDAKSEERKAQRDRLRMTILPYIKKGIDEIKLPWKEDRLAEIILPELERQLAIWASYNLKSDFFAHPPSGNFVVPMRIHFGLFALQLIREKFLFNSDKR